MSIACLPHGLRRVAAGAVSGVRLRVYVCHAGTDVARKMIILGRECGLAIEMQQVTVQSLVPPQLADAQSAEEFMQQLPQVLVHPAVSSPLLSFVALCSMLAWEKFWAKLQKGWAESGLHRVSHIISMRTYRYKLFSC